MHVHHQAALGGEFAQQFDALRTLFRSALEMRNAADHIDAQIERALELAHALRIAQYAVLREGHQLHVDVGRDLLLHLQQRFDRQQARVADIDVAANCQQALGHCPVAISHCAIDQRLLRQQGFEFTPQRNAFEQRARLVHARQAVAQRGVHVKVRVDKGRAQQQTLRVDDFVGWRVQTGSHFNDALATHSHRHLLPPVGKGGVPDQ